MLSVTVQSGRKVTVFRCQGRIVTGGDAMVLRNAVLSWTNTDTSVLDLAEVERIDAGGVGLLLDLRRHTRARGINLKLVNLSRRVRKVMELLKLDRILEIASPGEADCLLYRRVLRVGSPLFLRTAERR